VASVPKNPETKALGLDVGGRRKGFDAVLMDGSRAVLDSRTRIPIEDLPKLIPKWEPDVIAIDSPYAWAITKERETERFLRGLGISLYQTPWQEEKKSHPFYAWMIAGFEAFRASIESGYRLFDGGRSVDGYCIEVYPHASAVVLGGGLRPPEIPKHRWRRSVLRSEGIDPAALQGPDHVDAALAALTGIFALEGVFTWRGNPGEGVIVLPCVEGSLLPSYARTVIATNVVQRRAMVTDSAGSGRSPYPDRSSRVLSASEKAEIRQRLSLGGSDSYQLAREFACAVVQIAGIKAAMTLARKGLSKPTNH
jgi:predicted nuclease with RNAse H fold